MTPFDISPVALGCALDFKDHLAIAWPLAIDRIALPFIVQPVLLVTLLLTRNLKRTLGRALRSPDSSLYGRRSPSV